MKKIIQLILFAIITVFLSSSSSAYSLSANYTLDWQKSVYGFRTLSWSDYDFVTNQSTDREVKKIASLSGWRLEFDDQFLPRFSTYPHLGFREDLNLKYVGQAYETPPSLGYFRPSDFPSSFSSAPSSSGDWAHREFTYNYGSGKEFRILMSRLTPAVLVESNAEGIRLFDGPKSGISQPSQSWQGAQGSAFVGNPAYLAVPTSGGIKIRTPASDGSINVSGMNQKWFLMWFGQQAYLWGGNSVLFPGRGPSASSLYDPSHWLKPVDMPVLVVAENFPQSIKLDPAGGVALHFSSGTGVGKLALMPLMGSFFPPAVETELWSTGLPQSIVDKSQWWFERLGQFPVSVSETFSSQSDNGIVQITNSFTFRSLGHGTPYAPIPPVVALAEQEGFPINFDETIVDSGLSLAIGPYKGIDNATSFSYQISGLIKYALEERTLIGNTNEPDQLRARLNSEIAATTNAGHLAPWWPMMGTLPVFDESAIWSYPWETPYYLNQTANLLEDPIRSALKTYTRTERHTYPPESYQRTVEWLNSVQTIPYALGKRRESHIVDTSQKPNVLQNPYNRLDVRSLMTFYTLANYYRQSADTSELQQQWEKIKNLLSPYLNNSDWSTLTMTPYTWPQGSYNDALRGGINETNRMVAGSIGLTRLAVMVGDTETVDLGYYLMNKALISRFAQEKLVKYLYEVNLQQIPQDADWLLTMSLANGETGVAILWRDGWSSYADDVRRPLKFDQFGIFLSDSIPARLQRELLSYKDLTPELGRFLHDFALSEANEWFSAVEENSPSWYRAYTPAFLGTENPFSLPQNAHQIFLVQALILGASPEELAGYLDIPWVHIGDYYYIHKLAETIKAFRGYTWDKP